MSLSIRDDEFEDLYGRYYLAILLHLKRLAGQHELAENLSQGTVLKAIRAWAQHDQAARVRAWLYRIATNTAYDYPRWQRKVHISPLSDAFDGGRASRTLIPL